jgi:hypothetical protein
MSSGLARRVAKVAPLAGVRTLLFNEAHNGENNKQPKRQKEQKEQSLPFLLFLPFLLSIAAHLQTTVFEKCPGISSAGCIWC